jgi:hypothetical protein
MAAMVRLLISWLSSPWDPTMLPGMMRALPPLS